MFCIVPSEASPSHQLVSSPLSRAWTRGHPGFGASTTPSFERAVILHVLDLVLLDMCHDVSSTYIGFFQTPKERNTQKKKYKQMKSCASRAWYRSISALGSASTCWRMDAIRIEQNKSRKKNYFTLDVCSTF
jgi:hypothetical protein